MGARKAAALAVALLVSAPAAAQEFQDSIPTTMFFVSVPLGGATVKERMLSYGLALKGRKQYETVYVDSRMLNFTALGGFEAKWLIAGGLALGAGYLVLKKDGGGSDGGSGGNAGSSSQGSGSQSGQPSGGCQPVDPCKK